MAKKKKQQQYTAPVMTRGQLSRKARERQQEMLLYRVIAGVAIFAVLVLGYGVYATYIQHPNEELAKVGNTSITRSTYEKYRRYSLYQQEQTSAYFQQQQPGTDLSTLGLSDPTTLAAQIQTVGTDPIDSATVDQLVDNEVLKQKAQSDLNIHLTADEIKDAAVKSFLPSPTPPTTPEPSATTAVTGTSTITPTDTLTPTPGSPTATATRTPTLPPVPSASATAVTTYKTVVAQIGTGAKITEQDYLDLIAAPSAYKDKATELLSKDVPTTTEAIHAQRIVTDTEAGANKIITMLKQGQDFTRVAIAQSSEEITKVVKGQIPNGGDLGWFDKTGLGVDATNSGQTIDKTINDAAWKLDVGQYTQTAFKDSTGSYDIVKVIEKNPKYEFSDTQMQTKKDDAYTAWFNKAKSDMQSQIRYNTSLVQQSTPVPTQPAIVPPTAAPPGETPTEGGTSGTPAANPAGGTSGAPAGSAPTAATAPAGSTATGTPSGPNP